MWAKVKIVPILSIGLRKHSVFILALSFPAIAMTKICPSDPTDQMNIKDSQFRIVPQLNLGAKTSLAQPRLACIC